MPELNFPDDGEVPADADAFLKLLAQRVPSLAPELAAMTAPGAAVDFGPIAERIESLSDADRQVCEQMFASFLNVAVRPTVEAAAEWVTDEHILSTAVNFEQVGPVEVGSEFLGFLGTLVSAGRALTVSPDVGAVRVLLASGYAPVLVSFDHSTLVRDIDEMSRQLAVSAAAREFVHPVEAVSMSLTEALTAHPDATVRLDVGRMLELTGKLFVEVLRYFPDVVEHFDATLAEYVSAAADRL